jgi:hypothetical protein
MALPSAPLAPPEETPPQLYVQRVEIFIVTNIPPKRQIGLLVGSGEGSGDDRDWSLTRTVTIYNLPSEVLLEIFDQYRQSFVDQPERVWNNKNGWFKLAHVCHNWRCLVLA